MLSFLIFVVLIISMIAVSYFDKAVVEREPMTVIRNRLSVSVTVAWTLLAAVMIGLYIFFNGN